jgi:hypothetical protein
MCESHLTCGQIARGSQVFRGRETYEKTSPDDLDTLGKKTPPCRGDLYQHPVGRQGDDACHGAPAFDLPDRPP